MVGAVVSQQICSFNVVVLSLYVVCRGYWSFGSYNVAVLVTYHTNRITTSIFKYKFELSVSDKVFNKIWLPLVQNTFFFLRLFLDGQSQSQSQATRATSASNIPIALILTVTIVLYYCIQSIDSINHQSQPTNNNDLQSPRRQPKCRDRIQSSRESRERSSSIRTPKRLEIEPWTEGNSENARWRSGTNQTYQRWECPPP